MDGSTFENTKVDGRIFEKSIAEIGLLLQRPPDKP